MTVFSNVGYMGIPLTNEILGSQAVLYVSVFILVFNLLIYTYGAMILRHGNIAAGFADAYRRLGASLVNPGVLSGIIAVALYLAGSHAAAGDYRAA